MGRIIMMFLRNLIFLPAAFIRLMRQSKNVDAYTDDQHFELLNYIVQMANRGGNVEVKSFGSEMLPREDGFVFYPNHQGMYDALALIASCDKKFIVVAKKEAKDIPLLKHIFRIDRALFMDREDVRQSLTIINEASKLVQAGKNIVLFAEGTRSRKGNKLNEFKAGSFKCAMKAKCPIVPVALINSFVPFDSKSLRQVTVQVHFLKPLSYEDYKGMKTNEIAELVQHQIEECIAKYAEE